MLDYRNCAAIQDSFEDAAIAPRERGVSPAAQHARVYPLGHSDAELKRLVEQSRYFGDLTEQVLRRAGLAAGMRVLDLGCGMGDVSFLAAALVGPTGQVVGVDKAPTAVDKARERANQAGIGNVRFEVGDAADYRLSAPVDAVIGRLVLMYLPDPVESLRRLARQVALGTLFVFHEIDISTARAVPESPLFSKAIRWIVETFRRTGTEIDMGSKLHATFRKAGFTGQQLLLNGRIEGGPDAYVYEGITQLLRTLLPMAERFGVVSAAEAAIDTLAARLRDDLALVDGVVQPPAFVGAWARVTEH